MSISEKKENRIRIILLAAVLILGIGLRVWHIGQMHYANDELSALSRTNFSSLSETVEKGVIPDGHPALIQVFLYYWAHWVDYDDVAVKLPFLLAGILSLILMFFIGKEAGGWYAGLLAAGFAAVSQPFVYFSQVARPYAPGLLFTLLTVFFIQKILKKKESDIKLFFAAAVSLALTFYTHYFAALTTTLFWVMAFFAAPRKLKLKFIAYGLFAALLFLPHLPITLTQLSYGGLQWLSKPDATLYEYLILYLFNYDFGLLAFTIIFFLFSLMRVSDYKLLIKNTVLYFLPFVLTLVIGGFYSVYRAPVLQFSVMLFAYAFLVIYLFLFVKKYDNFGNRLFLLLIILNGWDSLVFKRAHFEVAYDNPFYKVAKFYVDNKQDNNSLPLITVAYHKFYVGSYVANLDKNADTSKVVFNYDPSQKIDKFIDIINSLDADSVVIGFTTGISKVYLSTYLRYYYPVLAACSDYAYLFVKDGKNCDTKGTYVDTLNKFVLRPNGLYDYMWHNTESAEIKEDSITGEKYFFRTGEWGVSFSENIKDLVKKSYNILVSSAIIQKKSAASELKLVAEIKDSTGNSMWWNGIKVFPSTKKQPVVVSAYLNDIKYKGTDIYKTYLWNAGKDTVKIYRQTVFVLRGKQDPYLIFLPKGFKK